MTGFTRTLAILATAALTAPIGTQVLAQDSAIITKQDEIGGVYEGTFRGGLQHGTGTYRLPNGYEYSGQWVDGEIRGRGVARFPNGSVYEGEFAKGKPEGLGKITLADGGTYEGEWVAGVINGQGVAVYANGVRYEGGFVQGQHQGKGVTAHNRPSRIHCLEGDPNLRTLDLPNSGPMLAEGSRVLLAASAQRAKPKTAL